MAPALWAAKPWVGSILMIRLPIVLMIRQPPAEVPSAIAPAALTTTTVGHVEVLGADVAVGDQRQRDDAHRLLGVVGAVGEREQADGRELRRSKPAGDRPGRTRPTMR